MVHHCNELVKSYRRQEPELRAEANKHRAM
jgi:hypothetical protein